MGSLSEGRAQTEMGWQELKSVALFEVGKNLNHITMSVTWRTDSSL